MEKREFHNVAELEEVSNTLARASRHPVYIDSSQEYDGEADPVQIQQIGKVAIWNNREDRLAYMGTEDYSLLNHRDVIDMIRSAVGDTVGDIDKGVVRDYGEKVDGTIVFGNQENAKIDVGELIGDDYVIPEGIQTRDELGLGMRFTNSFDGGSKIQASTMGYRYICGNWMVWGEETIGEIDSRHVGEIDQEFFASVIEEVFDTRESLEEIVVESESEEIPLTWVDGVLEEIGFGKRYRKRIGRRVLEQDRPSEEETTMWRLYNAVTTELDNNTVNSTSQHTYNTYQKRAWNLVDEEPNEPEEQRELAEVVGLNDD